jgi:hypothetical protein
MRRMILRMIANGSLSAFSAGALQDPPLQGAAHSPGSGFARLVRQSQVQPQASSQAQSQVSPQFADPSRPGAAPSGRILPRGSLLDLSV